MIITLTTDLFKYIQLLHTVAGFGNVVLRRDECSSKLLRRLRERRHKEKLR